MDEEGAIDYRYCLARYPLQPVKKAMAVDSTSALCRRS
jgi:hypothetical protein